MNVQKSPVETLFNSIEDWKVDARATSESLLFYKFPGISKLDDGQINFVIGRKGSGKTAIAYYLNGNESYDKFSTILSFKNFSFNLIYENKDRSYTSNSQYILIWKFIIYNAICSLMSKSERIDSSISAQLKEHFSLDFQSALSGTVKKLLGRTLEFSVLGNGISYGNSEESTNSGSLSERVEILEKMIGHFADDSKYFVLFDALDDDYSASSTALQQQDYFNMLSSLLSAVAEIRFHFEQIGKRIVPVIFLRDDIYDQIQYGDKNKWNDHRLSLNWNQERLEDMVLYRMKAGLREFEEFSTIGKSELLSMFFSDSIYRYKVRGRPVSVGILKYMLRPTHDRPRDIIYYVRECAKRAIQNEILSVKIGDVKECEKEYSQYFYDELIDEISPKLGQIRRYLDVFSSIRKPIFTKDEFYDTLFRVHPDLTRGKNLSGSVILSELYKFGIVGNVTKQDNLQMYSYSSNRKDIDLTLNLCIHRGLYRALKLVKTRDMINVFDE